MPTNVVQKQPIMKLTETVLKANNNDEDNSDCCSSSAAIVSNNDPAIPKSELALLAKLEEANRLIETDAKTLISLSNHSRRSSDTSQISLTTTNSLEKNDDMSSSSSANSNNVVTGEDDLWAIWGQIVNDWDCFWRRKNGYVRDLVRKGVPHHFRGIVWQFLCDVQDSPERKMYANYIKATSACEKVIRRDIARTYPEHDFFKEKDGLGQESLFNVMKAYSLHDREVGYCQGSAFIVGLLLMQMPEEETFAVLVHIMQKYRMRDMFKPSMAELGLCMFQLENLVMEQLPELHLHFKAQNFHTSMYASSWFLTLLTTTLSLPLACRVMDVFLVEGMEIIFKMALALLILGKDDLMCFDMEGMLKFFQKDLPIRAEQDPESLMNTAYSVKYNARKMKKLQKEYTTLKIKEQEEMMELKRLRTENRQLKQRNELLEAESARLAQRLIQGQVSRAEEVETTFVLESELSQLRNNHLDTVHNLELAYEEIRVLSMRLQEAISSRMSSMEETSIRQDCDDLVKCLQDELVKVRLREAENEETIKDLHDKIDELESEKKILLETKPDSSVARLQEELMAVKLREAESNLSLKDLRERVQNLNEKWQKHVQEYHQQEYNTASIDSVPKKLLFWDNRNSEILLQQLDEELMSSKITEVAAVAEVKELRLKVLQLESQVQLTTNQLRRQDEEAKKLRDDLECGLRREQEVAIRYSEQRNICADFESRLKEEEMNARIRDAEKEQLIAELKQKIGALEMMNHEMTAERELRNHSIEDSDKICELHDKVAELKAEVIRLKMRHNKSSASFLGNTFKSTLSVDSMSLDIEELKLSSDDSLPIK